MLGQGGLKHEGISVYYTIIVTVIQLCMEEDGELELTKNFINGMARRTV
jgi:hypothetical protein